MITTNKFYTVMILIVKLLPIILILAAATCGHAQGLKVSTYVEKTKASAKLGHSVGIVFPGYLGDVEVGGFFQKSMSSDEGLPLKKLTEQKFYGIYIGAVFFQTERVNMNFNIRTGLVNDKFLNITPSVFADIMLSRSLGFGFGMGMRNLQPTYSGRVILRLDNINNAFTKQSYAQKHTYRY